MVALEAISVIAVLQDDGVAAYEAVRAMKSRLCNQSGILKRLRKLWAEGIIEERSGRKKSPVREIASKGFHQDLLSVLEGKIYVNSTPEEHPNRG